MSILSSVTSLLEPIKIPGIGPSGEDCKPTKCDDRGDEKHKGREESKNDDHEKQCKNDDHDREKHAKNDDHDRKHGKNDDHDREKHAKNDDHDRKHAKDDDHDRKHAKDDDHDRKHAKNDDHDREHAKNDDHDREKHAKDDDHSKHAKNDCQPNKDDCQAHKDYCEPKPSDDCGKGETHKVGEALAKFDFSHGDVASHAPDHSDTLGALASMSSGHALDYASGQMGPADHLDVGHFDMPLDTSHDMAHHA